MPGKSGSGCEPPAVVEGRREVVPHAGQWRAGMDYYAHSPDTDRLLERLAATSPTTLACMHGPAWRGDGAALLRRLATRLAVAPAAH
jgi:hypothetical protein